MACSANAAMRATRALSLAALPARPPSRPPPPVYEDAWVNPVFEDAPPPEPVFADDDEFLLGGGAAPWDVIQ